MSTGGAWYGTTSLPGTTDYVVIDPSVHPYTKQPAVGTLNSAFNTLTLIGAANSVTESSSNRSLTIASGSTSGHQSDGSTYDNTIQGTISVSAGTLSFDVGNQGGTLSGGTISVSGGVATLSSTGTAGWNNAGGKILVSGGTATLSGAPGWINTGTISASGGTLTLASNFNNNTGTISQSSSGTLNNTGTISQGTVLGTINNTGTLSGATLSLATISGGTIVGGTLSGSSVSNATNGAGTLTVTSASTWSGGTNSGTLLTSGGGTLTIQNTLANTGGIVSGAGGTVSIASGGLVNFGNVSGIVTNNGELHQTTIGDGSTPTTVTGGTISGLTSANSGNVTNGWNSAGSTFTGTGGTSTWTGGTNSGTLTTAFGGTLSIAGSLTNTNGTVNGGGGTLTVASGATVTGGTVSGPIGSSGTLNGVTLTGVNLTGGTLSGATAINLNTLNGLINSGTTTINSGTTTLSGTITNTGSTFAVAGGLLVLSGATISGGSITGTASSQGSVQLSGLSDPGGFDLTVTGGTTSANGDWNIGVGDTTHVDSGATLDVAGNINNTGGTLAVDGSGGEVDSTDYTQTAGTLSLNGTLDVSVANLLGGAVSGTGDLGTNNLGTTTTTVNNGTGSTTGVTLYVAGDGNVGTWNLANYSQTTAGTLVFDINGETSGTHDQINVNGTVTPGGNLTLNILGGVGGALWDQMLADPTYTTIPLIVAGPGGDLGVANPSDRFNLLSTLPEYWSVVYNENQVDLEKTPEPAPYLLIGGAIVALGLIRRRRSRIAV